MFFTPFVRVKLTSAKACGFFNSLLDSELSLNFTYFANQNKNDFSKFSSQSKAFLGKSLFLYARQKD